LFSSQEPIWDRQIDEQARAVTWPTRMAERKLPKHLALNSFQLTQVYYMTKYHTVKVIKQ